MASEQIWKIIRQVEDWDLGDLERLASELDSVIKTAEEESCEDCGHRPQNGACYHCKMD